MGKPICSTDTFARVFIATIGYERSLLLVKEMGGKQIRLSADYNLNCSLARIIEDIYLPSVLFDRFGGIRVSVPTLANLKKWKQDNMAYSEEDAADVLADIYQNGL